METSEFREKEISERFHTGVLLARLMTAASLSDDQITELMDPDMHLSDSEAPCINACCERILLAAKNKEKVFIGGDYDADGICSTAIMKKTLDRLGIVNGYYIPDRFREGYGLSEKTVRLAHEKGYSLIITVDNGIKAYEAVSCAKQLGMDVIITDHHRIDGLPEADLIVHPDYMEEQFAYLSGAGVALEISRKLIGPDESLTALAAAAAIGDVMPLWRETRKIVLNGLDSMKRGVPAPLCALLYTPGKADWTSVAFQIVPKLNSVGRMNDLSNVNTVVRYLLLNDRDEISRFASQLEHVNTVRKQLSASMTKEAEKMITGEPFEIIFKDTFHEGICGLAAGKLASSLHKPVLIMAEAEGMIKGSGRSIPGFDMFSFFSGFPELQAFGGHEQAVGLTIRKEDLESFTERILRRFSETVIEDVPDPQRLIPVRSDEITFENISSLEQIPLYPKEMNDILFELKDPVILSRYDTVKVTKLVVEAGDDTADVVIYASRGIRVPEEPKRICGRLSINRWRQSMRCQIDAESVE